MLLSSAAYSNCVCSILTAKQREVEESYKEAIKEYALLFLPKFIPPSLRSFTVHDLRKLLELNDAKRSGNKDELFVRCVDGKVRGALPKCPQCKLGSLYYAGGRYHCLGYFDIARNKKQGCSFSAEKVVRTRWEDLPSSSASTG